MSENRCNDCPNHPNPTKCGVYEMMKAMVSRLDGTTVAIGRVDGEDIIVARCSKNEETRIAKGK